MNILKTTLFTTLFMTAILKGEGEEVTEYNSFCDTNVDRSYDFFASANFIYWQPIQENMSLGVVSNNSGAGDLVNGDVKDLDSEFKPGFQVGFGVSFDYDKWNTYLEYTWFRATESVSVSLNANNTQVGLFPAWQIPSFLNPQYSSGKEEWTLQMHIIDWDLARNYAVGEKLCFRPFIGLRWAIIDQTIDVDYKNTNPASLLVWSNTHIEQTSDSWGIGPRVGLTSNWRFGEGWWIFGDGGLDILFTQYDLESTQTSEIAVANRFKVKQDDANYLRTHIDLKLGLGWGTYYSEDKYHVDLTADYGFQVFFDQNMFRSAANAQAIGKSVLPNGNLYIHGLTISLRFDF